MSAPPELAPTATGPSPATAPAPIGAPARRASGTGIGVVGWMAVGWLVLVVALALLAPVLPLPDPRQDFRGMSRAPLFTDGHILGADKSARDVLSRVIWGARSSLVVSVGGVLVGVLVGGTLGLISGFRRGRIDTALSSLFDILLAFPQLVLALSLAAFLRPRPDLSTGVTSGGLSSVQVLIIALGVVAIPLLARITRATTMSWSQREFVLAGKALGSRNSRLMLREVLPNVAPAMFSVALLGIAIAIIAEGGLSLLGLGVEPPNPSWGNMIAENRSVRYDPLNALYAALIAVFLTVLSLNYLGDVLRRKFDVRDSAL